MINCTLFDLNQYNNNNIFETTIGYKLGYILGFV